MKSSEFNIAFNRLRNEGKGYEALLKLNFEGKREGRNTYVPILANGEPLVLIGRNDTLQYAPSDKGVPTIALAGPDSEFYKACENLDTYLEWAVNEYKLKAPKIFKNCQSEYSATRSDVKAGQKRLKPYCRSYLLTNFKDKETITTKFYGAKGEPLVFERNELGQIKAGQVINASYRVRAITLSQAGASITPEAVEIVLTNQVKADPTSMLSKLL